MAAYFVFHNRIRDAEKMNEYVPRALETMAPYNPEILVLDENSQVIYLQGNCCSHTGAQLKHKSVRKPLAMPGDE